MLVSLLIAISNSMLHFFQEEDEQEQSGEKPLTPAITAPSETVPSRAGSGEKSLHAPPLKNLRSHSESIDVPPGSFVYELTGIVIHSGQAHAGHYYSFIRDRGRMEPYASYDNSVHNIFNFEIFNTLILFILGINASVGTGRNR